MASMDSDVSMMLDDEFSDFQAEESSDDDDFFDENIAPKKKVTTKKAAATKAPAKKKAAAAGKGKKGKKAARPASNDEDDFEISRETQGILSNRDGNVEAAESKQSGATKKKKTIEETYQKKTQLEHILLRPDTYIGSTEPTKKNMYVLDCRGGNDDEPQIVARDVTYTPGLFKIFDEILVNAADNKQRDPNMDKMEIVVDPVNNSISVKNNGKGIPVVMHKEHKVYVPTMIFGQLLTGSNFDDDEKKTTGGRNGYGAKLANVFSTKFEVECMDTESGVKFHQVFRNNMSVKEEPTLKKCTAAEKKRGDYVKITFSPDLRRFGMTHLDDDTVGLMSRRAYDIAGSMSSRNGKKLAVSLNGKKLPIKSFKDYLAVFSGVQKPVAYEKDDRWEVGVGPAVNATMEQISFVNGINTSKGGHHVTYIADQVAAHLTKIVKKKNKGNGVVKPNQIKNHLFIFVNCLIENPAFDSQTKENLTTRPKAFGSTFTLPPKFLKAVEKSEVVTNIVQFANFQAQKALKRKGGTKKSKLTGIAKLDDANNAGTAKSKDCTLIITEGDSAKSLAMSGLSVVGRDNYGVFPLRGKPLNVRDTDLSKIMKNEEIKNLVAIMGLKFGTTYDESNIKTLRYGHLMIMADQDVDGSHIKGLVINFIHNFWPSLLDVPGFLQQFITPIIKASKGKRTITFFNLPEYENWIESTGNGGKGWKIKYYKGLGTSTSGEAKEYFSNLEIHELNFDVLRNDSYNIDRGSDDMTDSVIPVRIPSGSDLIDMVFRKDRVADRKEWLGTFQKNTFLDYAEAADGGIKYSDFINKDLILFSKYDCERSIPHLIDGFKPSQRKVLFGCFKRKLKGEIKVAQLVGYISEHSAYHHGEASLQGTIVAMAQSFCGSNNVNLLTPSGQFGTRRMGGKDAASPRYIFTKLEKITRAIFHPDDDELLNYLQDDGANIEPEYYMPVLPMILVNGADGIGTGYSSTIPNYNPREIIDNLRRKIAGEQLLPMVPFYGGFTGGISEDDKKKGSYAVSGRIERLDDTTLLITELPIKKWTQDYKEFLEGMLNGDDKKKTPPEIKDFLENHTDTTVSFKIIAEKEKIDSFEKVKNGLYGKFKLLGSLSTSNMTLFDQEGHIIKYSTPQDILTVFYDIRLDYYVKRKELLVDRLENEQRKLSNKARFVEEVCAGDLIVSNRKRSEILQELVEREYDIFGNDKKKEAGSDDTSDDEDDSENSNDTSSDAELAKGYDYLLGMKIWTLTLEKVEELRRQVEEKTEALEELIATSPTDIWLKDLDEIELLLDERDGEMEKAEKDEKKAQKKNQKKQQKAAAKKKKGRGKKKNEWDSDMESSSEEDTDAEVEVYKVRKKPVASRAPIRKKAVVQVSSPVLSQKVEEFLKRTSEGSADLAEKLQDKLVVSPPAKKAVGRTKPAKKPAAKKVAKAAAKKRPSPRANKDSVLEFSSDVESEVVMLEPAPTKKKGQRARTAAPKSKKVDDSFDFDDMSEVDEAETDDDSVEVVPVARARRGRAAAKSVVYDMSSDEEESEEESDFE